MTAALGDATRLDVNGVEYEAVIGIECHVELRTETKMFCGCLNRFGAEPNKNVCPVCLGFPGALPVPNRLALELLVKAGLAFDSHVPAFSKFDRKNYFYPDMPKNYQISQYDTPLCVGGSVTFWLASGTKKNVKLTRIHLEEDTGKSIHAGSSDGRIGGSTSSLVDFNRAGVPLMECVSEPDIRSAAEGVAYLEALKRTFVAAGVSDVKMEEGSLRCDANVSIRPAGETKLGTKTEIKNMNSFRSVLRAIESELARHAEILSSGGRIVQETRGWDEAAGVTIPQRSKELAHDYRYFPDPDLVPIEFAPSDVERLREALGELPQSRLARLIETDRLGVAAAHQIVDHPGFPDAYDTSVQKGGNPPVVANLLIGDIAHQESVCSLTFAASAFSTDSLAELSNLIASGTINSKINKELVPRLWAEGGSPKAIVAAEGLAQVSDLATIERLVDEVLAANPQVASDLRSGKMKAMGFLVGQIMKASRGKANPSLAEERLRARVASTAPA